MNRKREDKLVKKVKRLIKQLGGPRWLHHFGPKIYELYEHLLALLVRHYCKGMSYRRVVRLLDMLDVNCPSKSALQSTMSKLPKWLWDKALAITSGIKHHVVALDGTGFSRTNPSYHYLRRIDGKMPKKYVKLTAAFDTKRKKWCAAVVRVLPAHDMRDAKYLLEKTKPKIVVADKAYDSNKLHEYCYDNGIEAHIPLKNYGKPRFHRRSYRRKAAEHFRLRTYHRRELVEAGNGSVKRKSGSSVNSKTCKAIRGDVYCKLLSHNLLGYFI